MCKTFIHSKGLQCNNSTKNKVEPFPNYLAGSNVSMIEYDLSKDNCQLLYSEETTVHCRLQTLLQTEYMNRARLFTRVQ